MTISILSSGGCVPFQAEGYRTAEKIERGININLNHGEYHTEITD